MRWRKFITLLGGAVATWPLAARAQQREKMRRIGVLSSLAETDSEAQAWDAAFRKRGHYDYFGGLAGFLAGQSAWRIFGR